MNKRPIKEDYNESYTYRIDLEKYCDDLEKALDKACEKLEKKRSRHYL